MVNRLVTLASAVLVFAANNGLGAISVGTNGSAVQTFDLPPPVSDWSSQFLTGAAGSITTSTALDAQVETIDAATVTNALGPPFAGACCSKLAMWASNSVLFPLTAMTRPTSVGATVLMATLRNDSGATISFCQAIFDLTAGAFTIEEMGDRLYFSLSGASNTWQFVREFTNTEHVTLTLNSGAWAPGALLHLLWVDDNSSGEPDTAYAIDNFSVKPVAPPLTIARATASAVDLSWPQTPATNSLEFSTNCCGGSWQIVTNHDAPDSTNHHVTVPADGTKFFRLRSF